MSSVRVHPRRRRARPWIAAAVHVWQGTTSAATTALHAGRVARGSDQKQNGPSVGTPRPKCMRAKMVGNYGAGAPPSAVQMVFTKSGSPLGVDQRISPVLPSWMYLPDRTRTSFPSMSRSRQF